MPICLRLVHSSVADPQRRARETGLRRCTPLPPQIPARTQFSPLNRYGQLDYNRYFRVAYSLKGFFREKRRLPTYIAWRRRMCGPASGPRVVCESMESLPGEFWRSTDSWQEVNLTGFPSVAARAPASLRIANARHGHPLLLREDNMAVPPHRWLGFRSKLSSRSIRKYSILENLVRNAKWRGPEQVFAARATQVTTG